VQEWALPEMTGWVVECADAPGFIAGMQSGLKRMTLHPFAVERFVDLPDEPADNRMNDAKADAAGRLWAGTMPIGCDKPTGSFYRIDPDARVTRVDTGYTVANGPAISPNGRWLLHTDSGLRRIYRFELHDDGSLGPRETFIDFGEGWGDPDGMTFDADGGLWVAHWGGSRVSRFDPDGRIEREIALPASQITSMAFAGDDLDRMFVTSAADGVDEELGGALFEVDPGCRGLAPHRFGHTAG
jgi:xylono-1,5-lactonase